MGVGEVFGHRFLSGTIARRLFVQALLLSLLAIVIISALQMVFRYREKLESITEEFERIEASQLKSIAVSLWLSDEALMHTQLEGLLNLPHMQFAEVRSAEGHRFSLGSPVAEDRIERDYPLVFLHRGSEIEIGRLVVQASPDRIHRELLQELGPLALGEAGKILVTAFLAFILFQLTVGRHLSSLARQSRDLDQAKPGSRFNLDRPAETGRAADELEVLVQALNLLYGRLVGTIAELRRANERLDAEIEERKRTEEALRESEARFRQVVESAPVPIGVYHASGRIEYFNPKLEETFGYSLAEVANVDQWFEKVYPDPGYRQTRRGVWKDALETAAQKGEPGGDGGIEANVTCRDGSVRIMQVFDVLMGDRRLAVFNDLTERMRSEEALRASLAEKETLLKEVHHRVKNNLQVISSLLSLQFRQTGGADPRAFLQDTQNRIRSMAMVHEVLYRSGSISNVGFSEYVGSLCEHLARSYAAAARGIRLTPRIAGVFLDLDQAIVAGLIINELVTNAMKHAFGSRPEGDIRVELQADGDGHLALRVADNGVGMPAGELPAAAGTLGLLLVRNLARQLDGELTVRQDHGTVFEIVFPCKPHVNGVDG
jgi:PAS domain S-box-containing protein